MDLEWLKKLSANFTNEAAETQPGWLVVDAEHEKCYSEPGHNYRWFAVVHRDTMGRLECPECGSRDGCAVRVWSNQDAKKIRKRWGGFEPFTHNADGTIKP